MSDRFDPMRVCLRVLAGFLAAASVLAQGDPQSKSESSAPPSALPAPGPLPETSPNTADPAKGAPAPLAIPLVEGFPSFGLQIPDLDERGKPRSICKFGSVSRINDREVRIGDSFVETYTPDGTPDLSMELKEATLDRFTRIFVAHVPVTIRRADFEITGSTMVFNALTKEVRMGGPVKMQLFNLNLGDKSDSEGGAKTQSP
ncbi:MAG: hypothetical protein RLZZ399_17 [Verrucomicrobiota bacterium]|jgi:hypothetical protein